VIGRLVIALGLGVGAWLHVAATGQVVAPAIAALVALVGVVMGPRTSLSQAAQALLLVGTAFFTFALVLVDVPIDPDDGGPKLQYVVASGTAMLTVAARFFLHEPERGDLATWAIGLVVFYSCGRVATPAYLPLAVAYLGLAWMHRAVLSDAGRHKSGRHVGAAIGMMLSGAMLVGGVAMALRVAYQGANAFVLDAIVGDQAGFGAGAFELGSMDGMRSSDEVVLRVHGPAGEHFRGQAYTDYVNGVWHPPVGRIQGAPPEKALTGEVTTIEFVMADQERLFLPDDAAAVAVRPGGLQVDILGVPRPSGDPPEEVRFDTTSAVRLPPAEPRKSDLAVPPEVAVAIAPLVSEWVAGAETPTEKVDAIRTRLEQEYTYSLHYERDPERDPVLQFLLESKLGHCEYFASGMALSARQAGVPARVVTGFRSDETSPFGGHRIVRERDAHAWVEVHLDGAWVRVDPSPQNSMEAGPTQAWLAGAMDDLSLAWDRAGPQVSVGVLLIVFVGLQIRTLLRNRRKEPELVVEEGVEGPPDWLGPLLQALAADGLERQGTEPVEVFAGRVGEAGKGEAAALLRRYAALRYGGQGDAAVLAREVAGLGG
jgi:transglutaminase-like putative cysteine protease